MTSCRWRGGRERPSSDRARGAWRGEAPGSRRCQGVWCTHGAGCPRAPLPAACPHLLQLLQTVHARVGAVDWLGLVKHKGAPHVGGLHGSGCGEGAEPQVGAAPACWGRAPRAAVAAAPAMAACAAARTVMLPDMKRASGHSCSVMTSACVLGTLASVAVQPPRSGCGHRRARSSMPASHTTMRSAPASTAARSAPSASVVLAAQLEHSSVSWHSASNTSGRSRVSLGSAEVRLSEVQPYRRGSSVPGAAGHCRWAKDRGASSDRTQGAAPRPGGCTGRQHPPASPRPPRRRVPLCTHR